MLCTPNIFKYEANEDAAGMQWTMCALRKALMANGCGDQYTSLLAPGVRMVSSLPLAVRVQNYAAIMGYQSRHIRVTGRHNAHSPEGPLGRMMPDFTIVNDAGGQLRGDVAAVAQSLAYG